MVHRLWYVQSSRRRRQRGSMHMWWRINQTTITPSLKTWLNPTRSARHSRYNALMHSHIYISQMENMSK
eukprot:2579998-Karenia_brevis.AAC.1